MANEFNISDQPGGGAGVDSFEGRTGAVVGVAGDYAASEVTNDSAVAGAFVDDALNNLAAAIILARKQLDSFTANDAVFVGASAASGTARNGHSLIAFDDTAVEEIIFEGLMSNDYDGLASMVVDLQWAAATAVAGDVKWNVQFERLAEAGQDLDVDGFAAALTVTQVTNATAGVLTYSAITFTKAQADGINSGESYRLKVTRDATNVADDMVGDAQLLAVDLRVL
jgi:hypothetical protein